MKRYGKRALATMFSAVLVAVTLLTMTAKAEELPAEPESVMVGDVELIWTEFYCPTCEKRISIDEMRRIEKEQKK